MIIPNLDFGGAQRSFQSLANGLGEKHEIYVCVFNTFEGVSFSFDQEIIDLAIPAGTHWLSKIFRFYQRWRAIRKLKGRLNIQISISYLEGANYLNILTKRRDKVLISVRGSQYFDETIGGPVGWLRKHLLIPRVYGSAHRIIALNQGIRRELEVGMGFSTEKVKVIRNFYEIPQLESLAAQPMDEKFDRHLLAGQTLLYAGRLAAGKGVRPLIKVFKGIAMMRPQTKFVILGTGPEEEQLIDFAKNNLPKVYVDGRDPAGLIEHANILFLGYRHNPYKFLKNADILLIASSSEGGPNILFESIICGTLVISADCPYGPKELLAPQLQHQPHVDQAFVGENGVLLPPIDQYCPSSVIHLWAQTVIRFLDDQQSRNAIEQRAKIWVQQYSKANILQQWESLI